MINLATANVDCVACGQRAWMLDVKEEKVNHWFDRGSPPEAWYWCDTHSSSPLGTCE